MGNRKYSLLNGVDETEQSHTQPPVTAVRATGHHIATARATNHCVAMARATGRRPMTVMKAIGCHVVVMARRRRKRWRRSMARALVASSLVSNRQWRRRRREWKNEKEYFYPYLSTSIFQSWWRLWWGWMGKQNTWPQCHS